jgi:Spy/CpxP family protein refolding chaperone
MMVVNRVAVVLAFVLSSWMGVSALEAAEAAKPAEKATSAEGGKKATARMPNYYKDLVTEEQRDKILAIVRDYNAKLAPLQEQVEKLTKERDAAVEAVLTPEQKKQLDDIKAAAKAARDAKKPSKKKVAPASAASPATPAPAAAK